jgi:histidinol-phosphate aminotransferase
MPDRSPYEVIKPQVRAASAYTLKHFESEVKLDQNESPYEIPETLKRRIVERVLARAWSRYPEFAPVQLVKRLARFTGWEETGILIGNGSNELISAAVTATLGPDKSVAIPEPTFALYGLMAAAAGATIRRIPLKQADFAFDVEALIQASRISDVVILCSPNSPTGSLLKKADAERLLTEARGLVIVDEAYHEFSGQTLFPLLRKFENLLLLRTLSKAWSLAGLRFGYMMSSPEITREIEKVKLPYNVNIFTLGAAELSLEELSLDGPVQRILRDRDQLYEALTGRPDVEVFPSHANFLLFRTRFPAERLFEALYERGVLVRDVSGYPMLDGCLRVSVGTPEENGRFLEALDRALETLK